MWSERVSIPAGDGYPLAHRIWRGGTPKGTLVLFNGVMSHAQWFEPIAQPLTDAGWLLVGADRRGTGENTRGRGDAPSAQVLVDDALRIIRHHRVAEMPLFLVGWCWGAVLAVNAALELGSELTGLVLLAPGLFPTTELKARAAGLEAAARQDNEAEATLESPIQTELFSDDPEVRRFIDTDNQRLLHYSPRFRAVMHKLGLNAVGRLVRLAQPTLLVLAERDRATDNAATLSAFAKLPPGQLETLTLPTAHGIQLDRPVELSQAILRFVDQGGRGAG